MQDKNLFEYAVIRLVPRVDREEFLNIGVILYCSKQKFLKLNAGFDIARIQSFGSAFDIEELKKYLAAFEQVCAGGPDAGSIGALPMAERFRWLTATRSTIVQTSRVHPGLCEEASEMLDRLFTRLVLMPAS